MKLRAIEPEDLDLLYQIENNTELWQVGATNVPYSRYTLHDYIATSSDDIYADRQVRMVVENDEGACVGLADLVHFEPQHQRAEVGIVILPAYRRKGYGEQAIGKLADYALRVVHLHQLYAVVAANNKAAAIWSKDKILLSGKGTLNVIATGDGCRGIKAKKDITIEDLTLNVTTSGNHLGEKPYSFGDFGGFGGGEMPDFSNFQMPEGGFPDFGGFGGFPGFGGEANDSTRQGGFGGFPNFGGFGGFPGFGGEANDSTRQGGFGGFPNFGGFGGFGASNEDSEDGEEGGGMGFAGKHKYVASTKGIASKGKVTINSGTVTVKTATAGAEGIEGKDGVIVNGGTVDVYSPDDAINANACIEFNGGTVIARSKGNDAVDSNPKGGFFMPFGGNNNQEDADPAIVITGGTVYAWSQAGSPEEGLDCDFAPLVIEGGTIFTVGGGMGEMPSVPTNYTSKQPSVLLIGINIQKEEPIYLYDSKNKLLETITIPFALRRSASLVSSPFFEMGETYTVKTKDYEKTFTLNENFTAVR